MNFCPWQFYFYAALYATIVELLNFKTSKQPLKVIQRSSAFHIVRKTFY